ncbi:MAG: peptidylprolyl isomerase [Planctomycetes bacterium]|nr:peptidylprolyl isomerase [Planctomycetota bacterium]
MAKRKSSRNNILGVVIAAALIGSVIGAIIFYDPGEPLPRPEDVKFTEKYDDEWGKLKAPISHVDVEHILISWNGANPQVTPKDPERTKEEAWELIEQIWNRYKVNPTKENFADLQNSYNEDTEAHHTYSIPDPRTGDENGGLVPEFADCAKSTEEGFARIVESPYGYHLIRRKKQGE